MHDAIKCILGISFPNNDLISNFLKNKLCLKTDWIAPVYVRIKSDSGEFFHLQTFWPFESPDLFRVISWMSLSVLGPNAY